MSENLCTLPAIRLYRGSLLSRWIIGY